MKIIKRKSAFFLEPYSFELQRNMNGNMKSEHTINFDMSVNETEQI
jgi:hypothetical protein